LTELSQSQRILIGSSDEKTNFGKNDVFEIIVYDRILYPEEHHQIIYYLSNKYKLSAQFLDHNHPVETFNYLLGAQQIGSFYSFGAETRIVNAAQLKLKMGSHIFKSILSPRYIEQWGVNRSSTIQTLTDLVQKEPSMQKILNMPFSDYLFWMYPFTARGVGVWEADEPTATADRQREYKEVYQLTQYLLSQYKDSGKTFYLGNWEGDWHLFNMNRNTMLNGQDQIPRCKKKSEAWGLELTSCFAFECGR
jgi:hypothetical protein